MQQRTKDFRQILIICQPDWEYGRNVVLGARQFAFTQEHIEICNSFIKPRQTVADVVRAQEIDGIIAVVHDREFEEQLVQLPIPSVNVSNVLNPTRLPQVTQDDNQVGRLAAAHLLACGCTSFAYWEQRDALFSIERIRGFREFIEEKAPGRKWFAGRSGSLVVEEGRLDAKMRRWLGKLPPKTGVFAVLDPFAVYLIQAAKEIGRRIPEDLAIIGAGNEQFWVNFENIPLSSVKLPSWQVGAEAAKLLLKLMNGEERAPISSLHLPALEVAARRSTDVLFVEDEAVKRGVAYIRAHAAENIYVEDVVRASGISRSGLQRRFAVILGKSILSEIQQARVAHVQSLLRNTEMKLEAIAEACSFPNTPRLHVLFRQITRKTPGEYRAQFRRS